MSFAKNSRVNWQLSSHKMFQGVMRRPFIDSFRTVEFFDFDKIQGLLASLERKANMLTRYTLLQECRTSQRKARGFCWEKGRNRSVLNDNPLIMDDKLFHFPLADEPVW